MDKKSLAMGIGSYVMWGCLPLYWKLLKEFSPFFVLANRIVWSAVFVTLVLVFGKKLPLLKETFKNKAIMKYLIPSGIFVTINWGVYILAVNTGHVVDASLGYYINPLMVFAAGLILFKEKCGRLNILALVLAAAGVVVITLQLGRIPYLSLLIAFTFMAYGICKKYAHIDGIMSVGVETLLITPAALLFMLFSNDGAQAFAKMDFGHALLLVGAGIVTSVPLILYSNGVNGLSFITMGFLQYISPTFMLIIGLLGGEAFQTAQAWGFGLIWAGLILFSFNQIRNQKALSAAKP